MIHLCELTDMVRLRYDVTRYIFFFSFNTAGPTQSSYPLSPPQGYEYSSAGKRGLGWGGAERPYTVGGAVFDPVNPRYGAESAEQAMGRKWRNYFGGKTQIN